ncbi:hypothetical protein ACQP1W_08660 [Spirillospora sp. CA-255316]
MDTMPDSLGRNCAPPRHVVMKHHPHHGACLKPPSARRSESRVEDRHRLAIPRADAEVNRVIHNRVPGLCFVRMRWNN